MLPHCQRPSTRFALQEQKTVQPKVHPQMFSVNTAVSFTPRSSTFVPRPSSCCLAALLWAAATGNYPLSSMSQRWRKTSEQKIVCLLHPLTELSTANAHSNDLGPGYLSQPLSGSTRSSTNTQSQTVCICFTKAIHSVEKLNSLLSYIEVCMWWGNTIILNNNYSHCTHVTIRHQDWYKKKACSLF